ncbi:MAG TPA: transcription termination factor NusA [Candidatus Babeliales bacterium]|nr:transcription termination factor NusA [Candidatus Babeliales bacterium]
MKLLDVIEELVGERGLDREVLRSIIAEGLLAAYEKKYPNLVLRSQFDRSRGDTRIEVEQHVVSTVQDPETEISLKKARFIDKNLNIGDTVWIPFEQPIGRIEVLHARQIIAGKIRKVEARAIYDEFIDKQGSIIHGIIYKCEYAGMVIKVDDQLAFLPKSLSSPLDKCIVGFSVRALLKEVLLEPRGDNQLILDRTSKEFVKKLFELEIPEIFEGLVEIKNIARAPGYKTKIVVASNDKNIDPVGTCVGLGGSRIQPILKELGGEKIDVIAWTDSREEFIKNALKPAVIDRVELVDDSIANIYLATDQRSLAIGRLGQNISLASQLIGLNLQLIDNEKKSREPEVDTDIEL